MCIWLSIVIFISFVAMLLAGFFYCQMESFTSPTYTPTVIRSPVSLNFTNAVKKYAESEISSDSLPFKFTYTSNAATTESKSYGSTTIKIDSCQVLHVKSDPDACNTYFECVDGNYVRKICPNGLYFDGQQEKCLVYKSVNCGNRRRVRMTEYKRDGCTYEWGRFPSNIRNCSSQCTPFYRNCKNGIGEDAACPLGFVFDDNTYSCIHWIKNFQNCKDYYEFCPQRIDCLYYLKCYKGIPIVGKCKMESKNTQTDVFGNCTEKYGECNEPNNTYIGFQGFEKNYIQYYKGCKIRKIPLSTIPLDSNGMMDLQTNIERIFNMIRNKPTITEEPINLTPPMDYE